MSIMTSPTFLPFFVAQFLGAFNDNLFKNALVILLTYYGLAYGLPSAEVGTSLVPLAGGLFILPFFLFSATAGQLADKYDKARLTRYVKISELLIGAVVILGFALQSIAILFFALFFLGVHSTFFGPVKYAILPQHVGPDKLGVANAWVEAGTFLAILIGTITGGILAPKGCGPFIIPMLFMVVAAGGYYCSHRIPPAPPPSPDLKIEWNILKETYRVVAHSLRQPAMVICILGISWFWLMGGAFLSIFAPYARDVLGAGANVVTLFLVIFSVGIGLGSFLSTLFPRGAFQILLVPLGLMAFSILTFDLAFTTYTLTKLQTATQHGEAMQSLRMFFANGSNIWLCLDLLLIATTAGLYIVPLYVFLQEMSPVQTRARIIAANNIINAVFMVAISLVIMALFTMKVSMATVFIVLALGNTLVALYAFRALPTLQFHYAKSQP